MQTSKIKVCAVATFLTITVLFCTSFSMKEPETVQIQYVVKNGDTLYSIAEEYGIKNWHKWRYETCKNNGIEQGGLIYPGQTITFEISQ